MKNRVIKTADGSSTIYVPELDEHYHSVNGAVNESMHVFINPGLKFQQKDNISIFEVGFGTGLNAWLTLLNSAGKNIEYYSIEKYPVERKLLDQIDYFNGFSEIDKEFFNKIHAAEWNTKVAINESFIINKIEEDFKGFNHSEKYDVVYYDAFAPNKQENMWFLDAFQKLYDALNLGGVLVTYCAKGVVKRMLKEVGFTLDMIPGPNGKREMTRAIKKT